MTPWLNWLVQGTVVVGLVAIALRATGWQRAARRYRVWQFTLALVLAQPVASAWWHTAWPTAWHAWNSGPSDATGTPQLALTTDPSRPLVPLPAPVWQATQIPATLAALWLALHISRLARDVAALRRVRRRCRPLDADVEARVPAEIRARLTRAGVQLVASDDVRAAAALGARRPLIALQPRVAAQLTATELEHTVLHEWAHIERRDLRASLVERLVWVAVGWHPAVAWMLGKLRDERELACDDVVVATSGSGRDYAALLARLASLSPALPSPPPVVGLAAHAVSSGLRRRVAHALTADPAAPDATRLGACALAITVTLAALSTSTLAFFGPGALQAVVGVVGVDGFVAPTPSAEAQPDSVSTVTPSALTPRRTRGPRRPSAGPPGLSPVAAASSEPDGAAAWPAVRPQAQDVTSLEAARATETVADRLPTAPPSAQVDNTATAAALLPSSDASATDASPRDLVEMSVAVARESAALARESAGAWNKATDASAVVARESKDRATATARFFTRLGKRVVLSVTPSQAP